MFLLILKIGKKENLSERLSKALEAKSWDVYNLSCKVYNVRFTKFVVKFKGSGSFGFSNFFPKEMNVILNYTFLINF